MRIFAIFLTVFLLASCTARNSEMSLIVPKNANLTVEKLSSARVIRNIKGEHTSYVLVFIPLGQPNIKDAINQIIEKTNGDALINVRISNITKWFILGGINRIEIVADVVVTDDGKGELIK